VTEEQRAAKAAKQRAYYAANREAEIAKQRARRAADPEKYRAVGKARREREREKRRIEARAYYAANRERYREHAKVYRVRKAAEIRDRRLRKTYGLSPEGYAALVSAQGGRCAICLDPLVAERRRTHVDHDHATGAVRGILCADCNVGLGRFRDRADALRRAADYLDARRVLPGAT
jgi:hypothetical protein